MGRPRIPASWGWRLLFSREVRDPTCEARVLWETTNVSGPVGLTGTLTAAPDDINVSLARR
jgi:hypothetical protein